MADSATLTKVIARIGDLPAIPGVVTRVMELTSDPNVAVSDVTRVIEKDPALAAKLLKVSNSSYYGMRQVVGTLKLALVILGVREVRNIVLGVSVLDTLRDGTTEILLSDHGLWRHSILVAGIAKKLGTHAQLSMQGEDFIAGLLHDIGKLVLWRHLNAEYRELYLRARRGSEPLHLMERDALGFDHADVAAALASAWNLPESLRSALLNHHDGPGRDLNTCKSPRLAALVRIANAAAHDDWERQSPEDLASCTEKAWAQLETDERSYPFRERRELLLGFVTALEGAGALAL
jgi:HD-like signal output (HDOD) protein